MKKYLKIIPLLLWIGISTRLVAQSTVHKEIYGYISDIQSVIGIDSLDGNWLLDNVIHSRINTRWSKGTLDKNWKFGLDLRTRFIFGDQKKYSPDYKSKLKQNNLFMDLNWNIASGKSNVLNTSIERLYISRTVRKVEVTLGRQRINWGTCFVWNPNDLFNNASFFDFDYEEKPGSDALRIQYYSDATTSTELVASLNHNGKLTLAGMFRETISSYELQFITGFFEGNNYYFGTGWSGALGKGSFYGEAAYLRKPTTDSLSTFMASIGYAYTFSNKFDLRAEAFYTTLEKKDKSPQYVTSFFSSPVSLKQLSPAQYNLMLMGNYYITPLSRISLTSIYYPDINSFYISPQIDISLIANFSLTLNYQWLNQSYTRVKKNGKERYDYMNTQIAHIRFKYNF